MGGGGVSLEQTLGRKEVHRDPEIYHGAGNQKKGCSREGKGKLHKRGVNENKRVTRKKKSA